MSTLGLAHSQFQKSYKLFFFNPFKGIASGHGITGGHILEKAAFGSLDRYIKMKCREHQERSKATDKDDYYGNAT